jgi:hypothetical protein
MPGSENHRPPAEDARRAIAELDLRQIVAAAAQNYQWSPDEATQAQQQYLRHLWLCYEHPDEAIAPSTMRADLVWHQHILDTVRYRDDCEKIFGRFLDHVPFYTDYTAEEAEMLRRTYQYYVEEFHSPPKNARTCLHIPPPPPDPPRRAEV